VEKGYEISFGLRNEANPRFLKLKDQFPLSVHDRPIKEVAELYKAKIG